MVWKVTNVNVALSYTSMQWEREVDGSVQSLHVMVWNTDEMSLLAGETWEGVLLEREIKEHRREYISSDESITYLFKKTMMKGG